MTLAGWCANLDAHWDEAVEEVGEGRARVWRLYLAGSRLGFERNTIQLHQVLGVKLDGTDARTCRCARPGESGLAGHPGDERRPRRAGRRWSSVGSGRHSGVHTRPGSTSSRPSKNRCDLLVRARRTPGASARS